MRATTWVVAGLLVTSALAGCGDHPRAARGDVPLPRPTTIVEHGVTYRADLASPVGAALSTDGKRVTVYGFHTDTPKRPECSYLRPTARVEEESSSTVRVAAFDYRTRSHNSGAGSCLYIFDATGEATQYAALELRLHEPLGDRRLVDVRSGRQIAVLSPTYAPTVAGHLLDGYDARPVSHFRPRDGFLAVLQGKKDGTEIQVSASSPSRWSTYGERAGTADVNGDRAVVTHRDAPQENGGHCVSWVAHDGPAFEVCAYAHGSAVMPADDWLVQVARGVR